MEFKKLLPFILIVLGLVAVVVAFVVIKNKNKSDSNEEDLSALIDVALIDRPVAKLIPSEDGHWLKLVVDKLVVSEAASMDYELLYKLPDGRTQGVPGTIKLSGSKSIERDLLLGSESSGKFRYDEGVESGTLTLRYRNEKGKLIAKFVTEFSLVNGVKDIASKDGGFNATLDKASDSYFVAMETFGIPDEAPGEVVAGPYGLFSSSESDLDGEVKMNGQIYHYSGSAWEDSFSEATGIFVGISK